MVTFIHSKFNFGLKIKQMKIVIILLDSDMEAQETLQMLNSIT